MSNSVMLTEMPSGPHVDVARVAEIAVGGEQARGSGGFVWYAEGCVEYRLIDELPDETVRDSIRDIVTEDGEAVVVVLIVNSLSSMHVTKVPREVLWNTLNEESR